MVGDDAVRLSSPSMPKGEKPEEFDQESIPFLGSLSRCLALKR
jgi:hypothetical protein